MTTSDVMEANSANRRRAACHRCGWTQSLVKVTRAQRAQFGSELAYHWLCDECMAELTLATSQKELVASAAAGSPDGDSRHHRSVA
jgi:hypothetical protein